jgi:uncharacterized protein (DUF1810 family)
MRNSEHLIHSVKGLTQLGVAAVTCQTTLELFGFDISNNINVNSTLASLDTHNTSLFVLSFIKWAGGNIYRTTMNSLACYRPSKSHTLCL